MSNMLRKGKRLQARKDKKVVKTSTKEFYKIIGELDRISEILIEDKEVTEDNLTEKAEALTDIKIDRMERFVLKGKLGLYGLMDDELSKGKQTDENKSK